MAKTGLAITTNINQLDMSQMTAVNSIVITSTEPTNTTTAYAIRKSGGSWLRWNATSAAFENLPTQSVTAASLLSEGNTKTQLQALTAAQLLTFAGSKVDMAVAMTMTDSATTPPALTSIVMNGTTGANRYTETIVSDSIPLSSIDSPVEILAAAVQKTEVSGGTVQVNASIQDNNGNWSSWADINSYVTTPATKAKAIKLQAVLTAPTINTSQASLASVSIKHRTDDVAVFAEGVGSCVSKTYNFILPMERAHLMIKHPVVADTEVNAYISLRPKPISVSQEVLGVGDGAQHTYVLKNAANVAQHTFLLYFNGVAQTSGYAFSSADGKVTCSAPQGVAITTDYQYNWLPESWVAMAHDAQYPDAHDSDMVNDQFNYVASADSDPKGAVSAIKINLVQKKGTVSGEAIGTGNGSLQSYTLAHKAKAETLVLKANGAALDSSQWTYKDKTNTLFVTAASAAKITADYDWVADQVYLENFACVWNA